ncbi:unnamed protein product [Spirodela intermedia]|uniref:Uncharacterized protein n=1 Tax=Spirodela intermedia TaxID=51605 RepID=A0A7I8KBZ2_SPIIN|nr:unnamed protein product [Spirodela intermedia]
MRHQHKKRGSSTAQRPRQSPAPSPPDGSVTAASAFPPMVGGDPGSVVVLSEDDHQSIPDSGASVLRSKVSCRSPKGEAMAAESPAVAKAVKHEYEKALSALRRGNHTKATRLMKEAVVRHSSSAILHRVNGTVSIKVASLMDDHSVKLRHIRSAVDSARRAVALSPCSVEFALFYANLLYEAATDSKDYEGVVQECERALSISDPIDPARESLDEEESHHRLGPTPEARIAHVHQELRLLIQKANIASISSWVKSLNGASLGEDKFHLVPVHRLPSSDDLTELRHVSSARRPSEIKKATKTLEERRKEIEVRVAAARLLQQKLSPSSDRDDEPSTPLSSPSSSTSSGAQRLVERRKAINLRKVMSSVDRMEQVTRYWKSMDPEKRVSFLNISVLDLKQHFIILKDNASSDILTEALSFAEANRGWKFWLCCKCGEKFADSDSHAQHVMQKHMESLPRKLKSVLPQEPVGDWVEMLISGSWEPVDLYAAVKVLEEEHRSNSPFLSSEITSCGKDRDSPSDCCRSTDTHDSFSSSKGDSNINGTCSGAPGDQRDTCINNFDVDNLYKWPLSNDTERSKLLQRIHELFQLLLQQRCLAAAHLDKVIQFSMNEVQGLPSGFRILSRALNRSPVSICFLNASQLRKVLRFLQELSHSCGLGQCENRLIDDIHSVAQGSDLSEENFLICDSLKLQLDKHFFTSKLISIGTDNSGTDDGTDSFDTDAFIMWLFPGASIGEDLAAWTYMREEKLRQGKEVLQLLEKELYLLQNECEKKCEHLIYEEVLQDVENLCLEEVRRKDNSVTFDNLSYEAVLRKRREKLLKRVDDVVPMNSRFELDVISKVLKEGESLMASQFGSDETTSGVTSHPCEVHAGYDDEMKVQDSLYKADNCIAIAIQRQKELLSLELSKIDARIMCNVTRLRLLESRLGPALSFDYRLVLLPLMKSFIRSHLEDLVDKEAMEKSDAAREAFLAELALDAKKNVRKTCEQSKLTQEKLKDKRKGREHRKSKDIKWLMGPPDPILCASRINSGFSIVPGASHIQPQPTSSAYLNQQDANRHKIDHEGEEKKLGEALEYQRRIEHAAKQRHLAEQGRLVRATSPDDEKSDNSENNVQYLGSERQSGRHDQTRHLDDDSSIDVGEIKFGNVCWSDFISAKACQKPNVGLRKENLGRYNLLEESDIQGKCSANAESQNTKWELVQSHSKKNQGSSSSLVGKLYQKLYLFTWDGGRRIPIQFNTEDIDEERFQTDLRKDVCQSVDTVSTPKSMPAAPTVSMLKALFVDEGHSGPPSTDKSATGKDLLGVGLKNEAGEYNCFLNVIIQSLWHLRRFRDELLRLLPKHVHVGDPCVVCSLNDIFTSLDLASTERHTDAIAATCLRTALSNLYPDSNFFQEGQMNDASEVLAVIFDCLHQSFTKEEQMTESEENTSMGSWDCMNSSCLVHHLFGMNIFEQMKCYNCGMESRHLKYSSFFHNINANGLRMMKVACADSSLDELLKLVEMNHKLACDVEAGGCRRLNPIHHILSTVPKFFTIVLGWQKTCESEDDISATLAAFTTELDIGNLYHGMDMGNKHSLVSMVCYYGQHYVCFAYCHQHAEWVMYDDYKVMVIGGWSDVLSRCKRGHLQPQVLFFEAVD